MNPNPFARDFIPADFAIARYTISNGVQFASFPATMSGLVAAAAFRKQTPTLKGRRIRHVIQCYPQQVPTGVLLDHS